MKFGINTFTLKMIAVITMLIDHIGCVFVPQYTSLYVVLRVIGRIAFPIFAYTLAEGFFYTRNVKKYMLRMGILAIISEVPFDLALFGKPLEPEYQNVFFTLFLGLLMLYLLSKIWSPVLRILCLAAVFLISELLHTDYGMMGLLMIFWCYQFRDKKNIKIAGIALINVLLMGGLQSYAVLALIPILLHNGEHGPKRKGFFYGFYPAHLLVLYLVSIII